MYENLLTICLENKADIARCESFSNVNGVFSEDEIVDVLTKDEFMPLILSDDISSHLWKCIFKKELFHEIIFPIRYMSAEDMMVFHLVFNRADKLVKTNKKLYYYYADRVDNTSNPPEKVFKNTMCRAIAFLDRYIYSIDTYPEVQNIILKKAVRFTIATYCRVTKDEYEEYNQDMDKLYKFRNDYKTDIMSCSNITISASIEIGQLKHNEFCI